MVELRESYKRYLEHRENCRKEKEAAREVALSKEYLRPFTRCLATSDFERDGFLHHYFPLRTRVSGIHIEVDDKNHTLRVESSALDEPIDLREVKESSFFIVEPRTNIRIVGRAKGFVCVSFLEFYYYE